MSRGASLAVFVEQNRQALDCIRKNLKFTRLEEQARVLGRDVFSALSQMEGEEPFQIIFMDPTRYLRVEKRVLEMLSNSSLADRETLVIVEASLDTDFSYVSDLGFQVVRRKDYKTNAHIFLRRV